MPDFLMFLAVTAVILATFGAFVNDIWLASTQWLLVAAVFAIFAIYLKVR
ncbi:MAG: hypothetical protein ACOC6Q_00810 [Patescibacteria group bacterium]